MTTTKKVTNQQQARLSKLENKKKQLENLLRSRERLNFEINMLKKSISKDQKSIKKEAALLEQARKSKVQGTLALTGQTYLTDNSSQTIRESFDLQDDEDPQQLVELLSAEENLLTEIFDLLLRFDESGIK